MDQERGRMEDREIPDTPFTSAMTLAQSGAMNIPDRYILSPSQRPNPCLGIHPSISLPVIDLSLLNHLLLRSQVIDQVHAACNELGFFQVFEILSSLNKEVVYLKVINHGVPTSVMNDALKAAEEFFKLPSKDKMQFLSADVHEPVRYGTSMNHVTDKVFYWRDFIKHYANPISEWIHLWPSTPPSYKEKMGRYAEEVQILQKQLMEAVNESLGLNANYLHDDIDKGSQVMAVNYYPPCPKPDLALGMPPHSDYGTLTILNQSQQGLDIMDQHKNWHSVPFIQGALIVQLGDQIEVMSNGRYKSIVHRATVNQERMRFSIASLHSLPLKRKIGPAPELVDEEHPIAYKEGSFGEFLDYISTKCLSEGKYIDTLKNP